MKDYYDILGVEESASQEDIKSAYRNLAKKMHPDAGGDEAKFKELGEAYEILRNPQKRQEYDQAKKYGGNFGNFHRRTHNPFDEFDIFDGFGGFGNPFQFRHRVPDRIANITLDLTEAFYGKDIGIRTDDSQERNFSIPAGVDNGTMYRVEKNEKEGDVIVRIAVREHPIFKRLGSNLLMKLDVGTFDCMLGTEKEITTIEGKKIKIKIKPLTDNGKMYKISGYGMPIPNNPQARGDLLIEIHQVMPDKLSEKHKEYLENIRKEL